MKTKIGNKVVDLILYNVYAVCDPVIGLASPSFVVFLGKQGNKLEVRNINTGEQYTISNVCEFYSLEIEEE